MEIKKIENTEEREHITRQILEALPEWFGIPSAVDDYVKGSGKYPFWCSFDQGKPVGFICLKPTSADTVEIYVTGVLKEYHRQHIGRQLFQNAYTYALAEGFTFMQVKTVQMGKYPEYDRTNLFYRAVGFRELEVFPELWDEANPCCIYVMAIQ